MIKIQRDPDEDATIFLQFILLQSTATIADRLEPQSRERPPYVCPMHTFALSHTSVVSHNFVISVTLFCRIFYLKFVVDVVLSYFLPQLCRFLVQKAFALQDPKIRR